MLAPWKKSYDQLRWHIKKQRHYFANKGLSSQSYVFFSHVWMWELEYKNILFFSNSYWSQIDRIDTFELWCWRRLLRVPWSARRSNLSILKEVKPEHSLEGLMLKLKLQYFVHLIQRTDSLEKTLMLGKIDSKRRSRWQRMRWIDSITDSVDLNLSKFWKTVEGKEGWHAAVHGVAKNWTQLDDWTTISLNRVWNRHFSK